MDEAPMQEQPRKRRRPSNSPPIRKELVDRIRREIAAGTYITQEKWEAALDCLLERLE
jgi:hypothetical protein